MNNLPKVQKELEDMIVLIQQAQCSENDYTKTRSSVLYGNSNGRKKWQKLLLADAFPKPVPMKKKVSRLTGMDLHMWLKNHFSKDRLSLVTVKAPPINNNNYDEIYSFLIRDSKNIKNLTQKLLLKYCQYGACLEQFYILFCEKKNKGEISTSFGVFVRNEFDISDRQARRLRWLGRLWLEYREIGFLSLTLYDLLKQEKEINDLFQNYPDLAEEWKEKNSNHSLVAYIPPCRLVGAHP